MWRILIVEDIGDVRDQLVNLLRGAFGEACIDTAACVKDAFALIEQAKESHEGYDVVLLDFKLPRTIEENPEIDESVCRCVRDSMPYAYIVHFTGYGTDPLVSGHMAREHGRDRPDQARTRLIEKSVSPTWMTELLGYVRSFLEGKRIQMARQRVAQGLDRLFGTPNGEQQGAARARELGWLGGRGISHELEELRHDIMKYWEDLGDDVKKRVGDVFKVEEQGNGTVRVGLL